MFSLERGHAVRALRAALAALLVGFALPAAAFHFPWDQGHDTTNSNDPPPPGPCEGPTCDDDCGQNASRSPVYAALGHALWRGTDALLRGRPYLGIYRVYNSNDPVVGLFGNGWSVCFDVALYPATSSGVQQRIYKASNGKRFTYTKQPDGSFKAPEARFDTIVEGPSSVTMTKLDGRRLIFGLDGRLLERVDSNGNRVTFSYDGSARPVQMADSNGRYLRLTYNGASLVDTVADHGGRVWRYGYDSSGNLLSVTDPAGGVTRYTWQSYRPPADAQTYFQLLTATDPSGVRQVSFTYSRNQVSAYTDREDRFTYTRPASNTRVSGTVTRRDSFNVATSFSYGGLGLVTRDVDGMGGVTSYTYDANGKLTQTIDAAGRAWASQYDSLGRLVSSSNPLAHSSSVQYNGNDPRPVRATSPSGRVTLMGYDARGNLTSVTDSAGAVTRTAYSAQGDVIGVTNAANQTTQIEHNAAGLPVRVTDPLGRQTTMAYDLLGRVASNTNAAGEITRYTYDLLDRVTSVVDPLNLTTSFTYDPSGRLTSVTDAKGSVTRYEYDSFGRRNAEVAPDGRRTTYAYRTDNLLASIRWPDSTTISYTYDNNKRLTQETAGSEVTTFSYNAVNQITSANGPGGSVSFSYDAAGRLISETNAGRTQTTTRNAEGERTRLDFLGLTQTYARDSRGLVTRISAPAGAFDFNFDSLGRRTELRFPNGTTTRYGFDVAGQLTSLSSSGPFSTTFGHSYDAAGRLTRTTGDGPDWNYSYDALGRLTRGVQGGSTYNYTLDAVGNILDDGRTYDANHRLTGDASQTYAYDGRGNLTLEQNRSTGARVAYTWNAKNQLLRIDFFADGTTPTATRTLQYTYDPLGRRASKTDGGVVQRFVYDGQDVVGTLDAGGGVVAASTFGDAIDDPLATMAAGASLNLHADRLGSIVGVSNASSTTHTYRYGPFGETLAPSSADSVPFRYTAREKDTDSLYYYRARYYNPAKQRFLSVDPVDSLGSVSPYAYVDGDPLNAVDPTGEIAWGLVFAGADLAWQLYQNGGNWKCVNWAEVGLNMLGGGVLNAALKGAFRFKTVGSHTWGATRHWMNRRGIQMIQPGQQRHHWLFERNQGIGQYVPDAIKNQPWNTNPISSQFNNWLGRHPSLAWMGAPSWAGEVAGGAGLAGAGGSGDCECNK